MSDAWNSLKGGLSSIGSGISDMFSSGSQPLSATPSSTGAALSQGTPDIPDVSGGASPAVNLSAASADSGPINMGAARGTSALDRALSTMGFAGSDVGEPGAFSYGPTSTTPTAPITSPAATASTPNTFGGLLPRDADGTINWGRFATRSALPGAMLGYSIYKANQPVPEIDAMKRLAGEMEGRGASLGRGAAEAMQGRLPGGAQASVDQALAAAQARIRSNYAALGMTGSTPETQDLAYAELAASAQAFNMGQDLARTGFQAAGQLDANAATLYGRILDAETARGTALGDALAEFAAGLVDPERTLGQAA